MTDVRTPKQKLDDAIQEYLDESSGQEGLVRTDYILTVAAVSIHLPEHAIQYFHASSGPIHTRAGLKWVEEENLKMLNREEMDADNQ